MGNQSERTSFLQGAEGDLIESDDLSVVSVLIVLKRGGDGDGDADSRKANVISYTKKFGRTLH